MPRARARREPVKPARGKRRGAARPADETKPRRRRGIDWLVVRGARHNNLKNIDVPIPLGRFVCVTGVSGSGKSSLVNDILYAALARELNRATAVHPGPHDRIDGLEHLDKVIAIDQSPIGRTPRSNPATYTKVFDEIRALFAKLPDARVRGYKPGRFSFNVPAARGGGRCEACEGNGANRIEMDFLADVWVTCPVCDGRRFNRETLRIQYRGASIADVLEMDVQQALKHFENVPRIRHMLQTLHDVGLDYIKLGQSSTTLSGGEAQRVKLARELVKKSTGRTLYVLDEPTTGLHFDDIRRLLAVLHGFVDAGNTVVVIEHNLDVIKTADWIIDLGPEGGEAGGRIVVMGTPEQVAACEASHSGAALREVLQGAGARAQGAGRRDGGQTPSAGKSDGGQTPSAGHARRGASDRCADSRGRLSPTDSRGRLSPTFPRSHVSTFASADTLRVVGARQHNLRDVTVELPRDRITVCTGVSGSGKTSFAIDTVYAEGYRRYVESLSAYARQFLGQLRKPDVDHVEGLSPAICIERKAASRSPRSTVGTVTEVYDYMRVLWARVGTRYCPDCGEPMGSQTTDQIVDAIFELPEGTPIILLAPLKLTGSESWTALIQRLRDAGHRRVRIDGQITLTEQAALIDARRRHRVEVVIDRTVVRSKNRARIAEAVEHAINLGDGMMVLVREPVPHESEPPGEPVETLYSARLACHRCRQSFEELSPNHYSFNTPLGWCPVCQGLGTQRGAPVERVIRYPKRTILDGAVPGLDAAAWDPTSRRLLAAVCRHVGGDIETPLNDWPAEAVRKLLYGCEGTFPLIEGAGRRAPGEWGPAAPGWQRSSKDSRGRLSPKASRGRLAPDANAGRGRPAPNESSAKRRRLSPTAEPLAQVRVEWRGLLPGIDHVLRNNPRMRKNYEAIVTEIPCTACKGARIRRDAAATRLNGKTLGEVCGMSLRDALVWFEKLRLDRTQRTIARELLHEIRSRLSFLVDVGLDYLTLDRPAPTLSGGEAQRIQLAAQLGSSLSGVLYVLDEPTIGLHPRDTKRLIGALKRLRDLGNTLIVVEHDREVIASADTLLDFGPRAGVHGGRIVAQGTPKAFLRRRSAGRRRGAGSEGCPVSVASDLRVRRGVAAVDRARRAGTPDATGMDGRSPAVSNGDESLTRAYLAGREAIPVPANRRPVDESGIERELMRGRLTRRRRKHGGQPPPAGTPVSVASDVSVRRATAAATGVGHGGPTLQSGKGYEARTPQGGKGRGAPTLQDATPDPDNPDVAWLIVRGARHNNLKNIDVAIPLTRLVCITGVSGSGKSSLVNDLLYPALARELHRAQLVAGEHDEILGSEHLARVVNVDQSPIGATPASNPATYTGVFDLVRELFARVPEAKMRGYSPGRFSFNRPGGRCEACEGQGQRRIEMHFMADVWVECEVCGGRRYNAETLEIRYRGKTIADVLAMTVDEALELFENVPQLRRLLRTLSDVGLGYIQLGQPAPTLSAGEAQRVKLAAELGRVAPSRTLYILDEPTTGLHFDDVRKLLEVMHRLTDLGNTVLVVEHNLDVIKNADWVIDLGPEAADGGGQIVVAGTPEAVAACEASHTGRALRAWLERGPRISRPRYSLQQEVDEAIRAQKGGLGDVGREQKLPWQIDGRRWHLELRTSRDGEPRRWEPAALEYVIELCEQLGLQANWNNRASVEVTLPGHEPWFLHAVTGGPWLLELYVHVPPGRFDAEKLDRQLGLRTLDEREDLPIYGDWPRVEIRDRANGWQVVVIYVHDKDEIATRGFERFIRAAVRAWKRESSP